MYICRISSTVSTGSSPSTPRRLASVPLTPSSFAGSLLPGEPLASSSKSVSSKCCVKARTGAKARRGAPRSTRMARSIPRPSRSTGLVRRSQERSTVPNDPPKVNDFVGDSPIVAHAYKNERDFLDYEFARAKVIEWARAPTRRGATFARRSCSHSFSLAPVSRLPRCAIVWCSTAAKEMTGTVHCLTPT